MLSVGPPVARLGRLEREHTARADAVERAAQAEQAGAVLTARLADAEARAAKAEQQAQTVRGELENPRVAVQAGQARLESAAREIGDAREQAK